MFHKVRGTAQIGVLAREGEEIHVEGRTVLGIVGRQCDECSRARGIVIRPGIEYPATQIAHVVIVGGEDIAAVMPLPGNLCDDIEALVVLQEVRIDIESDAPDTLDGLWRHPHDRLIDHPVGIGLEEFDRRRP